MMDAREENRWQEYPVVHRRREQQIWPSLFHCYDMPDLPRTNNELEHYAGPELCPPDLTRWRALRSELNQRHEARRMQLRFRSSPESYLATLEEKLSKERLPP